MKVSGEFPLIDLPELRILFRAKEGQLGAVFARFEIEVTSLSQAKLLLNLTDGLTAWRDATPIKLEKETLLDFLSAVTESHSRLSSRNAKTRCEPISPMCRDRPQ